MENLQNFHHYIENHDDIVINYHDFEKLGKLSDVKRQDGYYYINNIW